MKVLVTGGAGFIGGHVVSALLADGMRVGVLDDFSSGQRSTVLALHGRGLREADVLTADVTTDASATAIERWRPDRVVHLAAQPRVVDSVRAPVADTRTNVLGTVQVLDAAVRAGAAAVVVSSGGAVYGHLSAGAANREDTPRHPVSPYGLSKSMADDYVRLYRELWQLSCTILALGNVYGGTVDGRPGSGVIPAFAAALRAGTAPVVYGDGHQTRDFVHVTDVAEAVRLACRHGVDRTLNIGTGVETSVGEVLDEVGNRLAVRIPAEYRPARRYEVDRVRLDVSAAAEALGWRSRLPLADGLPDYLDRFFPAELAADRDALTAQVAG